MEGNQWSSDNDEDGRVLEWYKQAEAFEAWCVGKTLAEVEDAEFDAPLSFRFATALEKLYRAFPGATYSFLFDAQLGGDMTHRPILPRTVRQLSECIVSDAHDRKRAQFRGNRHKAFRIPVNGRSPAILPFYLDTPCGSPPPCAHIRLNT